ncbi:putative ATP-dependent RNA helicase TDRD12 isoform X3 [Pieris rapae]|uniref:putative ATP-dependent RNA helicase TDRD12 isoform X3 n=1 Tax=Pieris rapae TaxID=64459 RepID=UPI001E27B0F1|nr:putative ATP-dependent RNA helicase TDRD12 isoform X3 [Pieris rapae]
MELVNMLPLGSYGVKIIHYCNPHLIWVDKDNVLEQIGIYGIVPHGKSLAFNPETNSYCYSEFEVDNWLPAAMNLMKEFFADATDIWFSVIHLDDGTENQMESDGITVINKMLKWRPARDSNNELCAQKPIKLLCLCNSRYLLINFAHLLLGFSNN